MKSLNRQKTSTIPTLSENNIDAATNSEKAEMLNSFFHKCFSLLYTLADLDELDPVNEHLHT